MLALGFSCCVWDGSRPRRSLYAARLLKKGMTKQQVRQILGEPNKNYGEGWAYSSLFSWSIFYVRFDEHNLFEESDYDW
jgi:hypothetical protein